ncbi:uncharacterized protein LOC113553387 [Rhopalosiphum maidis]|uniref:uncharacterized protein LOC113553387 n=1 Tax=Rhopalosiphum maidis TaxID=43146 RepID=UPI000F000219|nr:uncharacterized protein LOC113553387 [Rhopalosiphum maidis]
MDQDEPCLAPQLCIRCRSYDLGRHVAVVSNADPCTCTDDETCPHNKKTTALQLLILKKKKISLQHQQASSTMNEADKTIGRGVESDEDDDDDCSSSSSSSTTSCSSCSSGDTTTSESE